MSAPPQVVVLVATYRRNPELQRLLHTLTSQTTPVTAIIVADNAADPACRDLLSAAPLPAHHLPLPENLGCGAGLRAAEEFSLSHLSHASHWWILDDDALPPPHALTSLLQALDRSGAAMSVPLLTDPEDHVWAFPEPLAPPLRKIFRQHTDPGRIRNEMGPGPHPACWATGACQLVRIDAARAVGLHRTDFWMLGEDLDFSMRLAVTHGICFITDLTVPHLPPETGPEDLPARQRAARKFRALLQNLTYLALRQPRQSAHLWRYLPGNYRRFFRTHGWSAQTARQALTCFWRGAVLGQPAGATQ